MSRQLLDELPTLRVLLPMAGGIYLSDFLDCEASFTVVVAIGIVGILMTAALFWARPRVSLLSVVRRLRTVPVSCLALSLGMILMSTRLPRELHLISDEHVAARIESISLKEQSMRLEATLVAAGQSAEVAGNRIMIYTAGCDYTLAAGDVIAFPQSLTPITGSGNPGAFDFGSHFRHKGIAYRQFIDAENINRIGTFDTFMTRIARYRRTAEHAVMSLDGLSPEARRLSIAIVLGNDDYIDPDVRDEFSAAGIAHVLALSGLHIAILTMLTMVLLYPMDRAGHKRLRLFVTLMIVAAYAVFTGLSPSVVRAAIMTAVVTWAFYIYRRTTIADALCIAAVITLAFRPEDLFSAGFWMSYLSVTTITVVGYTILPRLKTRLVIVNYITGIVVSSIAAMIATMPITIYCFNSVAPLSVVANVVVLPFFPLLMIACMMAVAGAAAGIEWAWIDNVVNAGNNCISWVADAIARLTQSLGIGAMHIGYITAVLAVISLIAALLWLVWRQHRYAVSAAALLIAAIAIETASIATRPSEGVILLNDSRHTPLIAHNGDTAVVWMPFDKYVDKQSFLRSQRNLLAGLGVSKVSIATDSNEDNRLVRMQLATIGGRRFLALGGGHWRDKRINSDGISTDFAARLRTDYAIATRRFRGSLATATRFVTFDTLIISGNVYGPRRATLIAECDSMRLPYIDIASSGAFVR